MQLREILSEMNILDVDGSIAVEIAGIACHAARVLPGDLYVALQREDGDGHAEIEAAIARGAAAIVCRRNASLRQRATRIEVSDTRLALAEAAAKFYGNPGESLHVIGVTGPNGWKCASLIKQILQRAGIETGLISTLRHEIGKRTLPAAPSLESCEMQRLFGAMLRAGCAACVVELPSISPTALKGIPVNVLVFTGGEQNLRALSHFVRNRASGPVCGIVNVDDENGRAVANSGVFGMQLAYGFSPAAEVRAEDLRFSGKSAQFLLNLGGVAAACDLAMMGRENVRHLLGAAAASLSMITPAQAFAGLRHVRSAPGALELVSNEHGFMVFVDQAGTAEDLYRALCEVRQFAGGRVLLALGSPQGTSGKDRYDLGRMAGQNADHIILTSDNPGVEQVEEICVALAQGVESAGRSRYHVQPDRAQAICELIGMAEPDDLLLIAGKGGRTYQVIGRTIAPFDDREIAAGFLENFVPAQVRPGMLGAFAAA